MNSINKDGQKGEWAKGWTRSQKDEQENESCDMSELG